MAIDKMKKKKFLEEIPMPSMPSAEGEESDELDLDSEDSDLDESVDAEASAPAAELSDEDLLAEIKKRGLSLDAPSEEEELEELDPESMDLDDEDY